MGEGGDMFSVGERQLLCLARSILAEAKLLIMVCTCHPTPTMRELTPGSNSRLLLNHCSSLHVRVG